MPATVQRLKKYKIGLLVVCKGEGEVVSVLSERDLVGAVADGGAQIFGMKVDALMTRDPITCDMDDSPYGILHTMNREGFRHMPVLKLADLGQATMRKPHDLGLY